MTPILEQILDSIGHEIAVIRHLGTKVTADKLDWKPTDAQRSIGDLLQYLTYCASIGTLGVINGNWDHAERLESAAATVTLESFDAAMEAQYKEIAGAMAALSDDDLANKPSTLPWGEDVGLARALLDMAPKVLAAYRMQFFLYLKQSGFGDLDTANCWVGVDSDGDKDAE